MLSVSDPAATQFIGFGVKECVSEAEDHKPHLVHGFRDTSEISPDGQ